MTIHTSPTIAAELHSLRDCLTLPARSLWFEEVWHEDIRWHSKLPVLSAGVS